MPRSLLVFVSVSYLAATAAAQPPGPRLDAYGDPLPAGALLRIGTVRLRPGDVVVAVAFTPDAKKLVTANPTTGVHVWDVATGKELHALPNLQKGVSHMAVAVNGARVATVGQSIPYLVRAVATGETLTTYGTVGPHIVSMLQGSGHMHLSPDGKWLAVTNPRSIPVAFVEMGTDKLSRVGMEPDWPKIIHALAFAPDGQSLVATGESGPVIHYDVASCKQLRSFEKPEDAKGYEAIAFSPDGKRVAAVRYSLQHIDVWDVANGKLVHSIAGGSFNPSCLTFTPDNRFLIAGGADNNVGVWEVATGKLVRTLVGHQSSLRSMAVSPDGKTLATAAADVTVRLWDWTTGKAMHTFAEHPGHPVEVRFAADGKTLISNGFHQAWRETAGGPTVHFWDATNGKLVQQVGWERGDLTAASLSADGRLWSLVRQWKTVEVRAAATKKKILQVQAPADWVVNSTELTAEGRYLTVSMQDIPDGGELMHAAVQLWDVAKGQKLLDLRPASGESCRGEFSHDGRLLHVLRCRAKQYLLESYDTHTGRKRWWPEPSYAWNTWMVLAPHGRLLATVVNDCDTVTLSETGTNQAVRQFTAKVGDPINLVAFSPQRRLLAAATRAGRIVVWDLVGGKELANLQGHRSYVASLSWSPDGKRLVTGGLDTTILLWDAEPWLVKAAVPEQPWTDEERLTLWQDLASVDGKRGYAAIEKLVRSPKAAVALLRQQLPPATAKQGAQLKAWAADLNSDKFAVRQQAQTELAKLGEAAVPALEAALASHPSLEVCRRVETLLHKLASPPSNAACLRQVRALTALEWIGSAEARTLLTELAAGEADAWLTREALAAQQRFTK